MSRFAKKQITFYFFIISITLISCMFIVISANIASDKTKKIDENLIKSISTEKEIKSDTICFPFFSKNEMTMNNLIAELDVNDVKNDFDCNLPFSYMVFISILFNVAINCKKFMKMGSL